MLIFAFLNKRGYQKDAGWSVSDFVAPEVADRRHVGRWDTLTSA
jgi:hypothetical protein